MTDNDQSDSDVPINQNIADIIDPVLRAYAINLVSALGGIDVDDEKGNYSLGYDALSILRDLRRWLRHEEKDNRLDLARCLGETSLVQRDLLEILALWSSSVDQKESSTINSFLFKIALASVELLTALTWPIEIDEHVMRVSHHHHIPFIKYKHLEYKRAILNFDTSPVLRNVIHVAINPLSSHMSERSNRDENIIRLVLYFFRNLLRISPDGSTRCPSFEEEISRSAIIDKFELQDVLQLLLTLSSNIEEFVVHDVLIMEILYYLIKEIDPQKVFSDGAQLISTHMQEFSELLKQEKISQSKYARHAPSRHNRFGAMLWVEHYDERVQVVSGQAALSSSSHVLQKMDQTKKWNKPVVHGRSRNDITEQIKLDGETRLSESARGKLRKFVESFLDASFNPLFISVRKAIERETERVTGDFTYLQFFYVVAWFLRAERIRRVQRKKKNECVSTSFSLVAGLLNQETFIFLNRFLQRDIEGCTWRLVYAEMRCFTEILRTVSNMSEAEASEEDRDISENILNRIFYEETTLNCIQRILRVCKSTTSLAYLDACTELSHVFLRMLEQYSKQNVDMIVGRRRKAAKKRTQGRDETDDHGVGKEKDDTNVESADEREGERILQERKFDFERFAIKFSNEGCIDTFINFTRHYAELSDEQLKRCHRFFYRVAFKLKLAVLLYRVDIVYLFYRMIRGTDRLQGNKDTVQEWEELVKHIFRGLISKLSERPSLFVEMLFGKLPSTLYVLEHGEHARLANRRRTGARVEWKFRRKVELSRQEKLAVCIALMEADVRGWFVGWFSSLLEQTADEREAWVQQQQLILGENYEGVTDKSLESTELPASKVLHINDKGFKNMLSANPAVKLVLSTVGMERSESGDEMDVDGSVLGVVWSIPGYQNSEMLRQIRNELEQGENEAIKYSVNEANGYIIRSYIRRRENVESDEEGCGKCLGKMSSGTDTEGEDKIGGLFVTSDDEGNGVDGDRKKRKRKRWAKVETGKKVGVAAKQREMLSSIFVHESDDETDEERDREFFDREEKQRSKVQEGLEGFFARTYEQEIGSTMMDTGSETESNEEKDDIAQRRKRKLGMDKDGDKKMRLSDRDEEYQGRRWYSGDEGHKETEEMPVGRQRQTTVLVSSDDESSEESAG